MRCEYLKNPWGLDTEQPRLSWILESPWRGVRQSAWQILVASSGDKLNADQGDLWDSGQVTSDQSIQVEYAGKPLESRTCCHWKVRVWDKDGQPSPWSQSAQWTMGLLKPEDWQARWITMNVSSGIAHPWLRRSFELKSEVARAEVYVNTPSHYELSINGQKVGSDVLAPAHVNLKNRFLYNVYEVSRLLKKGPNCIALWMGPGWYQPCYGNPYQAPIVRVQLEVHSADGVSVIGTDSDWRAADSCISQIGPWGWNNMGGERWDAGKYVKDWNHVTFDDSGWQPAVEIPAPAVENSWQALPGSRVGPPIVPKSIYPHKDKWVVDFGTTLTGWMRLRLSALKPGQTITIDYADLDASRTHLAHMANADDFQTFNQTDIYVAGNRGTGRFLQQVQSTRVPLRCDWRIIPSTGSE